MVVNTISKLTCNSNINIQGLVAGALQKWSKVKSLQDITSYCIIMKTGSKFIFRKPRGEYREIMEKIE